MEITSINNIPSREYEKIPLSYQSLIDEAVKIARKGRVAVISGETYELMRLRRMIWNTCDADIATRMGMEGTVLYVF